MEFRVFLVCKLLGRDHMLRAGGCKASWHARLEPGTSPSMAQHCHPAGPSMHGVKVG